MNILTFFCILTVYILLQWIVEYMIKSERIKAFLRTCLIIIFAVVVLWGYVTERIPDVKEAGLTILFKDMMIVIAYILIYRFRKPIKASIKELVKKYITKEHHL